MQENIIDLDGNPTQITLYVCDDTDVIVDGNNVILKLGDEEVPMEKVVAYVPFQRKLRQKANEILSYHLSRNTFPVLLASLYQYKDYFYVQYLLEDLAEDLSSKLTILVEQLINDELKDTKDGLPNKEQIAENLDSYYKKGI